MNMLRTLVTRVNEILALGAAWPGWPVTILVMATCGITFHLTDFVLFILSVQASLASAVMDIRQRAAAEEEKQRRESDAKRDALVQESVEAATAMLVEVRRMQDTQMDMMEASERRDKLAAKRDKMMLTALQARNDLLDFFRKEANVHDSSRKTRRATTGKRKTHGRANTKRP